MKHEKNGPNIYVLCPSSNVPHGGIKQLYRHVDILNKNGFSAFIIHGSKGFRCRWFENNTNILYDQKIFRELDKRMGLKQNSVSKITSLLKLFNKPQIRQYSKSSIGSFVVSEVSAGTKDWLVIPEIYAPYFTNICDGAKKIIFNQNAYTTFAYCTFNKGDLQFLYERKDFVATLVVSDQNLQYLKYIFPVSKFFRLHYGFNPKIFYYSANKKKQIAYMTRKIPQESHLIINAIKCLKIFQDYNLVEIDNKKEEDVAKILRESLIFLSFSSSEGCPMPPLEAMACGCVVVGYTGGGGVEYFKKEFSYPIEHGDILTFISMLESIVLQYERNRQIIFEMAEKAAKYVSTEYSLEREESDIVSFWKNIIKN